MPIRQLMLQLSVHDLPMEETDSLTDPMLLADIMEAREELEEAQSEEDVEKLRIANHGMSLRYLSPLILVGFYIEEIKLIRSREGRSHHIGSS